MFPVIIFRASALSTITHDLVVVGDHAVDNLVLRFQGQQATLTAAGNTEYFEKLKQISKYGFVEITG